MWCILTFVKRVVNIISVAYGLQGYWCKVARVGYAIVKVVAFG